MSPFWSVTILVLIHQTIFVNGSCSPAPQCTNPSSKQFTCETGTCIFNCTGSDACNRIICKSNTICHITCSGSNACAGGVVIDALNATELYITTAPPGGTQISGVTIKCPNNGPGGGISCHLTSTDISSSTQYYNTNIEAVEGFNDVEITNCDSNVCISGVEIHCGINYDKICDVSQTLTSCLSASPDGSTCQTFMLPSNSPTTNIPTTASPNTALTNTASPTTALLIVSSDTIDPINDNTDLTVNCDLNGIDCTNMTINCPMNAECHITCKGWDVCSTISTINYIETNIHSFTITCNEERHCLDRHIHCPQNAQCDIICTGGKWACRGVTIYGPTQYPLNWICNSTREGCELSTVYAQNVSSLFVQCTGGCCECRANQWYVPPNRNGTAIATFKVDDTFRGDGGTNSQYPMNIYAIYGFQDLLFIDYNGTYYGEDFDMHCYLKYAKICSNSGSFWGCDPNGDTTCDAPIITNNPTIDPTNPPSIQVPDEISTNFTLEIEIKDTEITGDVLDTVNETINDYLQALSINYDYQLTVDLITNRNGAILTVNVVIIATDDIPINEKDIIDTTQNVLTDKYEDQVVVLNEFATTTESVSNPETQKQDDMLYVYVIIGCGCTVLIAMLIFIFWRAQKKKIHQTQKAIELEMANTNISPKNGENPNNTDNTDNTENSEQLYDSNHIITTPKENIDVAGIVHDDSGDDELLYDNMDIITTPNENNDTLGNKDNNFEDNQVLHDNQQHNTTKFGETIGDNI